MCKTKGSTTELKKNWSARLPLFNMGDVLSKKSDTGTLFRRQEMWIGTILLARLKKNSSFMTYFLFNKKEIK